MLNRTWPRHAAARPGDERIASDSVRASWMINRFTIVQRSAVILAFVSALLLLLFVLFANQQR